MDPAVDAREPADAAAWRFKMKDLCEATGLERQAIHFYIQQGLLAPGRKTGRNMAWYTQEHIDRLLTIKRLQNERFLPLKAIKDLFDGNGERFSPEQQMFLTGVKDRLDGSIGPRRGASGMLTLEEVMERSGVDRADAERVVELELVGVAHDEDGTIRIPADDLWMFEGMGRLRAIGFTRERGFIVDELAFVDDAIAKLFEREVDLISNLLSHLPPDEVARMIEQILPVIHQLLVNTHAAKVRDFFASMP